MRPQKQARTKASESSVSTGTNPNQAKLLYYHVILAVLFICMLISVLLLCATIDAIDRHERQNNPSATMGGFRKGQQMRITQSSIGSFEQYGWLKKVASAVVLSVLILLIPRPSHALDFFTDLASWQAAVPRQRSVDIAGQVPDGAFLHAGASLALPFAESLTFDIDLEGRQVPSSWQTWSGGKQPAVLSTEGLNSLSATFEPQPVIGGGLEIEPNLLDVFSVTLTTADGSTYSLTQSVNGNAGAKFFGWVGSTESIQIACGLTINSCEGFAMGDMVIAGFAGTPERANCRDKSVDALAHKYGSIKKTASALNFPSVQALHDAIRDFCED
jgi:hypothetical protein